MNIQKLLIANRGEIAIRIARAAFELGIETVSLFSEDDALSLHRRKTDEARGLKGSGAAAYLDIEQIIAIAREAGCDAIHPGYGFLSENAHFATRCAEEGIVFVGPRPEVLQLFGDKVEARNLAIRTKVPVVPGTEGITSLAQAHEFLASLGDGGAMMIKAVSGGGGRGMRAVYAPGQVDEAYARCQSEAKAAFGNDAVYVEQLVQSARHIEVQVVGDGSGRVVHLWERECTIQRRNQKVIEIAPSPTLRPALRERITAAAVRLAEAIKYGSLGTFEFLLDASKDSDDAQFVFMEANPRLQVEHTVTEEITGIDLVKTQLRIAGGSTLADLGLNQAAIPAPKGHAIQLRINMETMEADGNARPAGGTLRAFEPPTGPGIRVDTFGYTDYTTNPNFDSLLAKLITHAPHGSFADLAARTYRALCEFRIQGVSTNIAFLQNLLRHPDVIANRVNTRFVENHIAELVAAPADAHQKLYYDSGEQAGGAKGGARTDGAPAAPVNTTPVKTPMQGVIVVVNVAEGDTVYAGQQVAVIEAMKMEHIVTAEVSGIVRRIDVKKGDTLFQDHPMLHIEETALEGGNEVAAASIDPDYIRPDLAEVLQRHADGLDAARPDAVARRRKTGQRTARENVADLCDADSFIEYGALTHGAQRDRYSVEELQRISPADGLIAGVGSVNAVRFEDGKARCMVIAYDYTVFAGTQGTNNHKKIDRMLQLAEQWQLPIVIFAEGGGGRPGDIENHTVAMLNTTTFMHYARLSGLVPRVCIVSGRSFAGNAALVGCSDVIIATANATVGMGGPAMVEGGGLGSYTPEEIGPVSVQAPNGVFDIVVADEAEAVAASKKYLSYFQGPVADWSCADQRLLRQMVPENRLRVYDMRKVIEALADADSVLELRGEFGVGIITAFIRIEGRPVGLLANNPAHLGGAIDADAADKSARFMQLCDAFDIPMLSLCDTPGFMVGPDSEKTAMVRHVSRMFVAAASITVPFFSIVLRKGYGLGSISMTGGSYHAPFFTVSWPSGEFGAMGIEGAAKLGYRKELEAVADPAERQGLLEKLVSAAYEKGKATSMAAYLEIDDVIDPAESRKWIVRGLRSLPPVMPRAGKKRNFVDTW
ncbi:carboxyl transferase domain-containing protein [Noviherbaspirillum sedimenti]|uniref:Carbamoyl-phosphate synthase large subunit n=1 Tax=Noviherbaspirillum sedimenti TaxID=2320865 RepID=A0A3A3G516_9BURK|nr:carboxyl transferase domain-containing protein [Noviherbaspirillum sedimenti]RJG02914.1 carbamoyl-phosphate synthase large subunit [Noviherbaspirillum sedimenti]